MTIEFLGAPHHDDPRRFRQMIRGNSETLSQLIRQAKTGLAILAGYEIIGTIYLEEESTAATRASVRLLISSALRRRTSCWE